MPTKAELIAAAEWLRQHKGDLPPAILRPEIGSWADIGDNRMVPVVPFKDSMTVDLPPWLGQSDAITKAASSDPTAEAADANLDRIPSED